MIKLIVAALATFTGEQLKRSNDTYRGQSITSYQNSQVQVRETRPQSGPAGVRISPQGDHLRDLATSDGGFAKLQFQLDLRNALVDAGVTPDKYDITFSDAPAGQANRAYPVIYVNAVSSQARTTGGVDTQELVAEALAAGVSTEVITSMLAGANFDGLAGMIALARATSGTTHAEDADETDEDGDAFQG